MQLASIDWIVIGAYFVVTIAIGMSFMHRAGKGVEEFFLAGRKLPWYLAGGSMVAGMFASDTPLFHSGNVRDMGLSACWLFFVPMFGALLAASIFARFVRRSRVVTDAEYIELRYSGTAPGAYRGFLAFYSGIFVASLMMGWITLGMVQTMTQLTGWDKHVAVIGMLAVVVVYASAAGMWGIVMTDIFQYTIASLGSLFLAIAAVAACGGLSALRTGLAAVPGWSGADLHYIPNGHETVYSTGAAFMTVPLLVAWVFVNGVAQASSTGEQGQRVLSCRTEKDASLAYVMFSVCYYALNGLCWVVVGLASMLVLGPTNQAAHLSASERVFPAMISRLMPIGMRGLMLAAMIASFMSATSVVLNWGSSFALNDLYRRFIVRNASQRHYVLVSRIACMLVAVLGGTFALQFSSLREYFAMVPQLLNGAVVVLLARHVWWRTSIWSEVSAMVASPIIGFYVEFVVGGRWHLATLSHLPFYGCWYSENSWLYFGQKLLTVVGLTTVSWVAVTLLTKPTDMAKLKQYYAQVRPTGPGWHYVRRQFENPPEAESGWLQLGVWLVSVLFVSGIITTVVEWIRGRGAVAVLWAAITGAAGYCTNRGFSRMSNWAHPLEDSASPEHTAPAPTVQPVR